MRDPEGLLPGRVVEIDPQATSVKKASLLR